jgi:hypothetical protein
MSDFEDELRRQGLLADLAAFAVSSVDGSTTGGLGSDPGLAFGAAGAGGVGTAGTNAKLYPLFLIEAVKANGFVVCFHRIGKGATACVKQSCLTNHGKTKVLKPVIRTLFISRSPTTIFIDPVMDSGLLSDDLFEDWMRDEKTVESWRIKFSLAAPADAPEITLKLMAKSEAHLKRAAEYKTPSKAPGGSDFLEEEILPELEEFVYVKRISDPETFAEELGTSVGLLRLSQVVGELESQSIDSASAARIMLAAVNAELLENQATDAVLNSKIDQTQSRMGAAPADVNARWSSPTLWGTVSEMASFLDTLDEGQGNDQMTFEQETKIKRLVTDLVTIQAKAALAKFKAGFVEQRPFLLYARGIKSSLSNHSEETSSLKARLFELEKKLGQARDSGSSQPAFVSHEVLANAWLNGGDPVPAARSWGDNEGAALLGDRMDKAEDDIKALIGEANTSAISFGGLGLRSAEETRAWASKNPQVAPGFGLFVNCFSILEWISSVGARADNLSKLKALKKMGMATLAEAKAMNSFDTTLPQVFLGGGVAPLVVMKNETNLPGVKTYTYWSNEGAGLRSKIGDELKTIREGITNQIQLRLKPGTTGYNLALLDLTLSISWVENLMNFIDDTYVELIRSGFSTGSAWSLTTRLVLRVFEDIGLVRAGVSSSFVIDNNLSNATTVLWASFQTHDGMAEYLTMKFKNRPSISSEYVKFLASNSGIEAVGQLTNGLKRMGTEVKEAVGKITSAKKQGLTACNKVDEVKTSLVAMEWRLVKLESK